MDNCPGDPKKVEPGSCGCGLTDGDTDHDGTLDCHESCPNDPDKIDGGVCGCGVPDTDFDNDGFPDCDSAAVTTQAVPYRQDFESGLPTGQQGWEYYSNNEGLIQVSAGALRLEDSVGNDTYSLNEAILHLNLSGRAGVVLTFDNDLADDYCFDFFSPAAYAFNGHQNADGIAVSPDGITWYAVEPFEYYEPSEAKVRITLDQIIKTYDIQYSDDFRIKFQQYGNGQESCAGIGLDNVRIILTETTRVSLHTDGTEGDSSSLGASISADGRFVAFHSSATNLVDGDTNGTADVFIHDRLTHETTRVSVSSDGEEANGWSEFPSISANGRFVAFGSWASNLVDGDNNNVDDIFVHDRQTGETTRVNVNSNGTEANATSYSSTVPPGRLMISSDGRFVVFTSLASNLVARDYNAVRDAFVHDRQTGLTTRVSLRSDGSEANGPTVNVCISANGRFVAFAASADNLVDGDENEYTDIFVHDRQTGETTRVNVSSDGAEAERYSSHPSISSDGRFVAFASDAGNLIGLDTEYINYIMMHDRQTSETRSVTDWSTFYGSELPSISADGRFVAFKTYIWDQRDDDDQTLAYNVFVHDRLTGETTCASVPTDGNRVSGWHTLGLSISANGRYVTFSSNSSKFVDSDTNETFDVFVRDRGVIFNGDDQCSSDPNKTEAGICGCGVPDTDTDGDGTPNCQDGCPFDSDKLEPGVCGCGAPDADLDHDGNPDCIDNCPDDPQKMEPGVCGCGTPDVDTDYDGTPDCQDNCPFDAYKLEPGICGCGSLDDATDTDGDSTPDCQDDCPLDPNKNEFGFCHCGVPETDTDQDGSPDCVDQCPNDPGKIEPGVCGCGVPDLDSDEDGTLDCNDNCPNDPDKLEPGLCGCGLPDTDSDQDGALFCNDGCPDDPDKTEPGNCGCGVPDTDFDHDGSPDCEDAVVIPQALPYSQGFEAGLPVGLQGWEYRPTNEGLVYVDSGILKLIDSVDNGTYSRNEAILHLDLAGKTGVMLSFDNYIDPNYCYDHFNPASLVYNGHQDADGISISPDGITWYAIDPLDYYDPYAKKVRIYLGQIVKGYDIQFTSDFRIKFQQYGNGENQCSGFGLDNIQVSLVQTTLVHNGTGGTLADHLANNPSISGDGRFITFDSLASNLIEDDTNGCDDIFVYDRQTDETTRVSVLSDGTEANGVSVSPDITPDGRYVVFMSYAKNLLGGDRDAHFSDIHIHDRQTGETSMVSLLDGGIEGMMYSYYPTISYDGRYVAFQSSAHEFMGQYNVSGIFVHDCHTGQNSLVSRHSDGTIGGIESRGGDISSDGRYVAFYSRATNLVDGDTNGCWDAFVHDRRTAVTTRVSVNSDGTEGNGDSYGACLSADGRYVGFYSAASNLVDGDTNDSLDVFVHDRQTGVTIRVSLDSDGNEGNDSSRLPSISGDGRFVAYESYASNLVYDDKDTIRDVFVYDRQTGETSMVSRRTDGTSDDFFGGYTPSISPDGRYIAYITYGYLGTSSHIPGIFVHDRGVFSVDEDQCPGDPFKTEPGLCGCGVLDTDSDFDGTPDCLEPPPDSDSDGLTDETEEAWCTDPDDADTDDDGIPDGLEDANLNGVFEPGLGETNPCDIDTDNDGLQDGTELGYTLADIGPDTNTSVFQPDMDPLTTTDPLSPDTDGDGQADGVEDPNCDGMLETGESDPSDPLSLQDLEMPWLDLLLNEK